MCGILAIVSQREPVPAASVAAGLDQLAQRGPDGRGTWFSTNHRTALGHTRLSIIGLDSGAQPIANESEQLHLIANGEFYDHDRITAELTELGHQFRTQSDSEIALHLFETYGHECLARLRGEFAFVIWDERTQTLFAARDRFGIKPLFYVDTPERLMIASEAKALFASGEPARWDTAGMFEALHFAPQQQRSIYENVRQLPPGHFLVSQGGSTRIERYWDADYPTRKKLHRPSPDSSAEISHTRSLLDTATHLRTRADVPLGCYLSGGIDSSSVLALATRLSGKPVTAFSVSFDDADYDESNAASEMARHVGADYHQVNVTGHDFASAFADAVGTSEMLHYNGHGPARFLLSRAAQKAGIKTVLGGEGADELFAGYGFVRRSLTANSNRSMWSTMRRLLRFAFPSQRHSSALASFSPFAARLAGSLNLSHSLLERLEQTIPFYRELLSQDFLAQHQHSDPFRDLLRQFKLRKFIGREPSKVLTYLWLKSHFANYVLAGERLDMAHAVEVRLPFLDHHLFEYTRTLPASLLYKNGKNKFLLRNAVAGEVTQTVLNGDKKPFFAPPVARLAGTPMHELVQDLLRSDDFHAVPFFDHKAVRNFLDRMSGFPASTSALIDPILYLLASTTILQQRYRLS